MPKGNFCVLAVFFSLGLGSALAETASPSDDYDPTTAAIAPFGIVPGEPLSNLKTLSTIKGKFGVSVVPPKIHPAFYEFKVFHTAETGVCAIEATAQVVKPDENPTSFYPKTDRDGSQTKALFAALRRQLEIRYGKSEPLRDEGPSDPGDKWASQLTRKARVYEVKWHGINSPDGQIGVRLIKLFAIGSPPLPESPDIRLQFIFNNFAECDSLNVSRENKYLIDDASKF